MPSSPMFNVINSASQRGSVVHNQPASGAYQDDPVLEPGEEDDEEDSLDVIMNEDVIAQPRVHSSNQEEEDEDEEEEEEESDSDQEEDSEYGEGSSRRAG